MLCIIRLNGWLRSKEVFKREYITIVQTVGEHCNNKDNWLVTSYVYHLSISELAIKIP